MFDIAAFLAAFDSGGATLAASGDLAADGAFVSATDGAVINAGLVFIGSAGAAASTAAASSPTWSGIVAGIVDSVASHLYGSNSGIAQFHPSAPKPQPMAELQTNMSGGTTTLYTVDNNGVLTTSQIETLTQADSRRSTAHAAAPYNSYVVGVSNRHGGSDPSYGPAGAFIDTGDQWGRDIHGGGSSLGQHAFDAQQPLTPTLGCTRGHNQDVINLGNVLTRFQRANPNVAIPYMRF